MHRTEAWQGARTWVRTPLGSVVTGVAAPIALTLPVDLWLNEAPFRPGLLYVAFVAVLAAYGGLTCGIVAAATSLGALWFVSYEPKYTMALRSSDDAVSLGLVAVSLAAVLVVVWRLDLARQRAARARGESAAAERRERLLLDVAAALGSARDRDEVRAVLERDVLPAASASSIGVLEIGDGPTRYDLVTIDGVVIAREAVEIRERQTPAWVAASTDAPLYLDESELATRFPDLRRAAALLGERARAAVPFELVGGSGAVAFGFRDRQTFPPEHRRFLETIGVLVGSTMRRIAAVSRSEEHRLALAFDAMLHGVGLYRAVRDEQGRISDFEVRLLNREAAGMQRRMAEVGAGSSFLESFPRVDEGGLFEALVHVVETGTPFMRDPWWSPVPDGDSVPFAVLVTKSAADEVLLVMRDVRSREEDRRAREEALVRAARDRAVMSRLEHALLPDELPVQTGHRITGLYRAAEHEPVGGDWYDALHLPNGDLALTVGDVAGHGLDATATMVFARSAVRALLVDGMAVDEALRRVDAILAAQEAFVTCWVATYSPSRAVATIASAGHPPALLGGSGSVCVLNTPPGPPLGVGAPRRPAATEVALPEGGILLAYTDGLVERRTRPIDDGIARLVDAVTAELGRAQRASAWLERVVERTLGDDAATDDVCVLALVREPHGWRRRDRDDETLPRGEPESDEPGRDEPHGLAAQVRSKVAAIVPPWRKRVRRPPFTS